MKIRSVISGSVTAVLILAFVIVLFLSFSSRITRGTPRFFGYELETVLSGSMEPTFLTGSIIAVRPVVEKNSLKPGDVVSFKDLSDNSKLITHRIAEVRQKGNSVEYVTKGDNNKSPDPQPIPSMNVVAKYSGFTIPYIGYVSSFARSKTGAIFMMIIPGALLILSQVVSLLITLVRLQRQVPETEVTEQG